MNKYQVFSLIIILLSLATAFYFYNIFPDKIDTHWNSLGQVNGTMGKFWGVFLFPILLIFIFLLFNIIPRIDPLKENIKKFLYQYNLFTFIIILFITYTYVLTIFWNLGYRFNITQYIIPGFVVLFYCIGMLLEKTKRNFFIGIRTPWTLSSDYVWDKTHQLGSKLFKISAIIILIGVLLPQYLIWFILIPILSTVMILLVYSYLVFKNQKK